MFTTLIALITGWAGLLAGAGGAAAIAAAGARLYAARTSDCCPCAHDDGLQDEDDPDVEAAA